MSEGHQKRSSKFFHWIHQEQLYHTDQKKTVDFFCIYRKEPFLDIPKLDIVRYKQI